MRFFEILILTVLLPQLLWFGFNRSRFAQALEKWLAIFPVLGMLFIGVHLLAEGYRWHMLPGYGLTAVFLLLAIRQRTQNRSPSRLAWLGGLLGLLAWLVAVALPAALPVPRLPDPTGPYAIGTFSTYLVDPTRPETYTDDPNDNRELVVQVWYPATNRDGEPAQYLPDLDVAGPVIAEQFDLPAFLLNHINLTKLDVWLDVPPADDIAPFPVIVFSHGLTGIRMQNTTMVRELVSHGYLVAAIDHSYANALTIFPDGRVFVYDPSRIFPSGESNPVEGNPLVQVWASDIAFLLDEMAVWNEEAGHLLNGRLDLNHIGIFGHSTGGGATMEFCLQDARCQAGAALDGWLLPVSKNLLAQPPERPFMFISTPRWLGRDNRELGYRIFNSLPQDGYALTLAGTQHYDFTDLPLLTPLTPQLGLSGRINSGYSLSLQNEYLLAFFNQYLKGEASILLKADPSAYPELTIERNMWP